MLLFTLGAQVAAEPTAWIDIVIVTVRFFVGPLNAELLYLLLAMAIDTTFGMMVAKRNRTWSWLRLLDLTSKKVMVYMLWLAMFNAFDNIAGLPNTARWSVIMILVGFEIISAVKNTSRLGYSRLAGALENVYLSLTNQQGGSTFDDNKHQHHKKDDDSDVE